MRRTEGPNARTGIRIVEAGDPNESSELALAMEIWRQLNKHYPNHPWNVSFQGGALIVRHAVINAHVAAFLKRDGFGFLLPKEKAETVRYRDIVQQAILAGGAMLELFSYRRGAWDGSDPVIPKDWKVKQQAAFA